MSEATLLVGNALRTSPRAVMSCETTERRLATLLENYYDFVWRALRRLGVRDAEVDDAAQRVFRIAFEKLEAIHPDRERSFLFQIALRVAADFRRASRRRRESYLADSTQVAEPLDPSLPSDELVELKRARVQLDLILDAMPAQLRAVFILHELEELAMSEIATLVGVPAGTVASRLRRARQMFRDGAGRLSEGHSVEGAEP